MKTVDIGRFGEKQAARSLKKKRLKILAKNLHISHNEIDIIAKDVKNRVIIFVEVKARSVDDDLYSRFGTPASAVTKSKQKRTIDAARTYISQNVKLQNYAVRFDVIEVYGEETGNVPPEIDHITNVKLFPPNWRFW